MEKIPTAEELEYLMDKAINYQLVFGDEEGKIKRAANNCKKIAIQFAKMHVEAALKDVEQKLNTALDDHLMLEENVCSILENINSYPVENIK